MAKTDFKQKTKIKKRVSVKFYIVYKDYLPSDVKSWRPRRMVITFCDALMVSILPDRLNLKLIGSVFPGIIGNCIHVKLALTQTSTRVKLFTLAKTQKISPSHLHKLQNYKTRKVHNR